MKNISIIFFVILITIQYAFSRTVEDVIEDFQHVFNETHDDINRQQTEAKAEAQNQIQRINDSIILSSRNIQYVLESTKNDIAFQVETILIENNLIDQKEKILHCLTKEESDLNILTAQSFAMRDLCNGLGKVNIENLENQWNIFYMKQDEHDFVENVKERCSPSPTANIMQDCLIQYLYNIIKPHIHDNIKFIGEFVEDTSKFVLQVTTNMLDCSLVAENKIKSDSLSVVDEFKNCVLQVKNNTGFINCY